MKIQILTDNNGNQIAKVTNGKASFSIQTNQNLPVTHRNGKAGLDKEKTKQEIKAYLFYEGHGTDRQRAIFNA